MRIDIRWFAFSLNSAILVLIVFIFFGGEHMLKEGKSTAPLRLDNKEKIFSLLPTGTSLYYYRGFDEGFSVYKVYVDIDRTPLELQSLDDPTRVQPIWAEPFLKDELLSLIKNYPIKKEDLMAILNTNYLSKEEIREVLEEFKKNL